MEHGGLHRKTGSEPAESLARNGGRCPYDKGSRFDRSEEGVEWFEVWQEAILYVASMQSRM